MAILKTYDLKGNKLSFANWISNLSPVDTPFASMIGKEAVDQTVYSWQTDRLASPDITTQIKEGDAFTAPVLPPTTIHSNYTQILRKVVRISDTANKVGLYGRASEKAYQMEKSGKELKRDLEKALLTQTEGTPGVKGGLPRRFKGFPALVAPMGMQCPDTGAIVHKVHQYNSAGGDAPFTEDEIFDLTYNLYLAGSKANKIMVNPKYMYIFSNMINNNAFHHVTRMFEGVDTKFNAYVSKVRDPLGQEFEVIPNRFMPEDRIYFFNEKDWTQMVLREPKSTELAKTGSSEKHMIEMEVGLRHSNPFASGILHLKDTTGADKFALIAWAEHKSVALNSQVVINVQYLKNGVVDTTKTGALTLDIQPVNGLVFPNNPALASGVATLRSTTSNRAGTFTVKISEPGNLATAVEVILASPDKMAPAPIAEEVEAPKARKAKAKAE